MNYNCCSWVRRDLSLPIYLYLAVSFLDIFFFFHRSHLEKLPKKKSHPCLSVFHLKTFLIRNFLLHLLQTQTSSTKSSKPLPNSSCCFFQVALSPLIIFRSLIFYFFLFLFVCLVFHLIFI